MKAVLRRLSYSDDGVFGILDIKDDIDGDTILTFHTLERPWRDNRTNVSCIPSGSYRALVTYSRRFQRSLYELQEVPGRGSIRIHNGNTIADTEGCILAGLSVGKIGERAAVLNSREALNELMDCTEGEPIELDIIGIAEKEIIPGRFCNARVPTEIITARESVGRFFFEHGRKNSSRAGKIVLDFARGMR